MGLMDHNPFGYAVSSFIYIYFDISVFRLNQAKQVTKLYTLFLEFSKFAHFNFFTESIHSVLGNPRHVYGL